MTYTPPTFTPYPWQDAPTSTTPLDSAHLEAAETNLAAYAQAIATGLDAYAEGLIAAKAPVVETINSVTTSGAAQTLPDPASPGNATLSRITLTANCTLTLPSPAAGKSVTVVTVQNATGGWTITWATPSGVVKWPGGASPTYTNTANAIDVTTFVCADGTNWLGMPAGYNFG